MQSQQTVGNCFNFRVMFDDLLFTCEPHHIKVRRQYLSRLASLMLIQAILATSFENFIKGKGSNNVVSILSKLVTLRNRFKAQMLNVLGTGAFSSDGK